MKKLLMIHEVAKIYNITKRTLRYYEDAGLLTTVKKNDSNYRYYDAEALNRLEQILLLRELNFHISEINEILNSKDNEVISRLFCDKLQKLQGDIDNLLSLKKIISSIISIKDEKGMQYVSLYEILKEQIYIHKNIERVFEMSQFVDDIIIIEFGSNIVKGSNTIIENIKNLRQHIKSQFDKEIPLIRVKDNSNLDADEYKITIKNIVVKQELLEKSTEHEKPEIIVQALKEVLIFNLQSITEH